MAAAAPATGVKPVIFIANGGTFTNGDPNQCYSTNENGEINQPASPVRDGYVFDGWYYDGSFTNAVDFSQPLQGGADHFVLFAKWTEAFSKVLNVTYHANGGQFFDGNDTMQVVTDTNGIARLPLQPTREGYDFLGWSYDRDGNDPVDFTKAIVAGSGHATLYAQWKQNNEKTVLYVANGGAFADGNETMEGVTDSNGVARQPLAPTREGYTFAGWAYDSEGTDPVDFSKPVQGGGDHVTFYAQWTKNETPAVQTHKVNFYFDGSTTTVEVEDGKTVAQPSDPSIDGFNFVGWSSSKESFKKFDFSTPITEDTTVYAFFTAKTPKSETLKKDEGKKQVAADKKDEAKAEKKDAAALPTTGDPIFVVTSAASLAGAVAAAVGMYMTKRREH